MGYRAAEQISHLGLFLSRISITPSWAFFVVCLAALFGLVLGIFFSAGLIFYAASWLFLAGFAGTVYRRPKVALMCALLAAFLLGVFRSSSVRQSVDPLQALVGEQEHVVSGIVWEEPDLQRRSVRFPLRTYSVDGVHRQATLLVVAQPFPVLHAGDVVELKCRFVAEARGLRPAVPTCLFPNVDIVRHDAPGWRGRLGSFRQVVASRLTIVFPEPAAGFIRGLLFGGSASLPERWREALLTTGTVHLVALSGFNITIIASLFLFLLRSLAVPRRWHLGVVSVALGAFVVAVGAPASVVRAAIMGLVVVTAASLGRQSTPRNAIIFAALLMAVVDPYVLVDDIGFQLSFLATIGIVIFYPRLETFARGVPNIFGVREALLLTLSAQILITPLIAWYFGRLSFIAPLVNAVVVPVIPFIMLFGALAIAASFVAVPLGQLVGLPAWMAAQAVLAVIGYAARVPHASALLTGTVLVVPTLVTLAVGFLLLRKKLEPVE